MSTNDRNARLSGIGTLLIALLSVYSIINFFALLFPPMPFFLAFGFIFPVLGLVGFILFMIGLKGLSDRYQAPAIFNNALYGLLTTIVGVVIIFIVSFTVFFLSLSSIIESITPFTANTNVLNSVGVFGWIFIPITIASLVVGLIVARFYFRAFDLLAEKSGIKRFRTVGSLYIVSVILVGALMLIGAALLATNFIVFTTMLTLVLPVNIITCVAFILATLGFFSIKVALPQTPTYAPTYQYGNPQTKYCTYCGAPNRIDASYCANCGKPTQPTKPTTQL